MSVTVGEHAAHGERYALALDVLRSALHTVAVVGEDDAAMWPLSGAFDHVASGIDFAHMRGTEFEAVEDYAADALADAADRLESEGDRLDAGAGAAFLLDGGRDALAVVEAALRGVDALARREAMRGRRAARTTLQARALTAVRSDVAGAARIVVAGLAGRGRHEAARLAALALEGDVEARAVFMDAALGDAPVSKGTRAAARIVMALCAAVDAAVVVLVALALTELRVLAAKPPHYLEPDFAPRPPDVIETSIRRNGPPTAVPTCADLGHAWALAA